MSKLIDRQLNQTLRDALVAYYLEEVVPNAPEFADARLADKLKTANDLYEYKLLDVQVSQDVDTSPVASAIASLQQYINGALMGMEPGYETRVMEDRLISQWREINSQYPIWAANQQLQYYPEAYIDPSLRLSKSKYFLQLENDLNQNKIHIDTTQEAVLSYLAGFEEVANLTIINGYINTDDFKNGMYYFIGKSRAEGAYYWRSVDMSQRTYKNLNGTDPDRPKFDYPQPGAWSDWYKVVLPVSASAIERTIRPVMFNNRLFVFWVEFIDNNPGAITPAQDMPSAPGTRVQINPMLRMNMIYKKYDDTWSVPQTVIEAWSEAQEFKQGGVSIGSIVAHDNSTSPDAMYVAMYAGYTAGSAGDGSADRYVFLKTALIDKSFNVKPLFPSLGYVPSVEGPEDSSKAHVLRVGRLFAHDNVDRFQFRLPVFSELQKTVELKSVTTTSPNSETAGWNYQGWQSKIANAVKNVSVRYNQQLRRIEFESSITGSFVGHRTMTIEMTHRDGYLQSRLVLVLPAFPAAGAYETLLAGSEIITINHPPLETTGTKRFSLVLKSYQVLTGYLRESENVDTVEFGVIQPGAPVSIAGRKISKEALSIFRDDLSSLWWTSVFAVEQEQSMTSNSWVVRASEAEKFSHVICRPEDMSQMTPVNGKMVTLIETASTTERYAPDTINTFIPINPDTLLPDWNVAWPANVKVIPFVHGIKVVRDGSVIGFAQKITLVELEHHVLNPKEPLIAPRINIRASPTLGVAEFIDFIGSSIHFSDDKSAIRRPIRMNTLFAHELINRANAALENLLTWETQGLEEPPLEPPAAVNRMDFHGANGKYFWELFLHLPFLVSQRLNLEQQFDEAERWLAFIFDPSRKQDSNGRPDYWSVRPLIDDFVEMDYATRKPADPDGIASSHPVRYRKAIYLHYLKNLLDRGDAAYRQLTPDSLGEAKLWYVRVLDLLGPRPDIKLVDSWTPITLQALSDSTNTQLRAFEQRLIEQDHLRDESALANVYQFAEPPLHLRTFSHDPTLAELDSDHLRLPINKALIQTWDIAESRLDNLRNNRTLDGKPLSLPLFAAPLNPRDLLAAYGQGAAAGGSARLLAQDVPHYRFRVMQERAVNAAFMLSQFGATLLSLIERKEQAQYQELQSRQAWELAQWAIDLQQQAQLVNVESKNALEASKAIAQKRLSFYTQRSDQGVSAGEAAAGALHLVGRVAEVANSAATALAEGLKVVPNAVGGGGGAIGGTANGAIVVSHAGGWRLEGGPKAFAALASGTAALSHGSADAIDRSEQYRRRGEEWMFERDKAQLEIDQIDAQLKVLEAQSVATDKQLLQSLAAQEHALATYEFLGKRFTNAQLYQWLNGQFATFYYQAYDATLALCLAAEACWQFELSDYTSRFIQAGSWNDSYRGLGVGDALRLQLLKMDAAYLSRNERRLEITKTISLRQLPDKEAPSALNLDWSTLKHRLAEDGRVDFELDQPLFESDYPGQTVRRIKRLSISLPVTLGPYEDIRAILTQTYNAVQMPDGSLKQNLRASQQVALSGGVDDDGLFTFDFNDERYLPFEGTGTISRWSLEFPNHTDQLPMLESLTDIIVHLRYTARAAS